jgi:predicted secreted protein
MDACVTIYSEPETRYDKTGSLGSTGNDLWSLKAVRGQAIEFLMGKRAI